MSHPDILDFYSQMGGVSHCISLQPKRRLDEAEDQISKLEDKVSENTQLGQQKEKRIQKNEESLRDSGTTSNTPTSAS